MSKALSLKLDEQIFVAAERVLRKLRMPRNAYINQAVAFYTQYQTRRLLKRALRSEARALRGDTSQFIQRYELLDDLPE